MLGCLKPSIISLRYEEVFLNPLTDDFFQEYFLEAIFCVKIYLLVEKSNSELKN